MGTVSERLAQLRALNVNARRTRQPADRIAYLEAVYRRARKWARSSSRASYATKCDHRQPENADVAGFIEAILRATSEDDRRLRFKHGTALLYAAMNRVPTAGLAAFIASKGGFNGCASRWAKARSKGQLQERRRAKY